MRILYKKHVKRIIIYNINIIYYNTFYVRYKYIYLLLYIHVARDAATDAAVVGHYKGGCTCVFNGAELLN